MAASCIASLKHQAPYRGLRTTGLRYCVHVAVSPSGDGLNLTSDGKFILLLNFCCGVEKSLPFIPCFHSLNKSSGNSGHWRLLMLQSNLWSWVYISSLSGRPALPSGCPQTSYDASSCSLTIHSFVKMDFSEHLFARARLQLSGAVSRQQFGSSSVSTLKFKVWILESRPMIYPWFCFQGRRTGTLPDLCQLWSASRCTICSTAGWHFKDGNHLEILLNNRKIRDGNYYSPWFLSYVHESGVFHQEMNLINRKKSWKYSLFLLLFFRGATLATDSWCVWSFITSKAFWPSFELHYRLWSCLSYYPIAKQHSVTVFFV